MGRETQNFCADLLKDGDNTFPSCDIPVLVSFGCGDKMTINSVAYNKRNYPPTVLEAMNQKSDHGVKVKLCSGQAAPSLETLEENPLLASPSFWWLQAFLGLW